jgi:hypothetical protein
MNVRKRQQPVTIFDEPITAGSQPDEMEFRETQRRCAKLRRRVLRIHGDMANRHGLRAAVAHNEWREAGQTKGQNAAICQRTNAFDLARRAI